MTSDGEVEVLAFGRPSKACACPPRRPPPPQVLFRPLAELCITAAVCNIIDAKEARDISKSGHPDMVMLMQLDEADKGAAKPVAPSPPDKAFSAFSPKKAAANKAAAEKVAAAKKMRQQMRPQPVRKSPARRSEARRPVTRTEPVGDGPDTGQAMVAGAAGAAGVAVACALCTIM